VRRRWRDRFVWVTVAAAVLATGGTFLAYYSGEGLEKDIDPSATLHEHIKLADSLRWFAILALLLLAAYVWVARQVDAQTPMDEPVATGGRNLSAASLTSVRSPDASTGLKRAMVVLAIAAVVSSGVSAAWVYRTGHEGAKATWSGVGQINPGG
jgi:drug/metabolite transporter (DMT)-like permease